METWGLTWRRGEGEPPGVDDPDSSGAWLRHPAQRFVRRCRVLLHGQEVCEHLPEIRCHVSADGKDRFVFHRMFEERFEAYCAFPLITGGAVLGELTLGYVRDTVFPETSLLALRQAAPILAAALSRADRESDLRSVLALLNNLTLISRRPIEEAPLHLSDLLRRLAGRLGALGALLRIVEREDGIAAFRQVTARWVAGCGRYSDWARESLFSVHCDLGSDSFVRLERGETIWLVAKPDSPPPTLDPWINSHNLPSNYWSEVETTLILPLGKPPWTPNFLYLELHLQSGTSCSPRRAQVIESLAEHMGLVLNLTHRLDEEGKRLKLLSHLSQELLRARRFESYRDLIVQTSFERLRAEVSTVFLYDKKTCKLDRAAGYPRLPGLDLLTETYEPRGVRRGITGRILEDRPKSLRLNDPRRISEEGVAANLKQYGCLSSWQQGPKNGAPSPVRHILVVPIVGENGKAFGALRVINKRAQDYTSDTPRLQESGFTQEDQELLETIAAAVASKLSSERRSERLETISRAMADIATASSREKVAEVVVRTIVDDLGYSACSFRRLTPEGLILLRDWGFRTTAIRRLRVEPGCGLIGRAIAGRRTLCATDLHDPVADRNQGYENVEFAASENLRGACSVPILGEDRQAYGAIVIYMRFQPYEFFSYEVELLETLSAAASISFRRLAADEEAQTARKRLERLFNILQALLIARTRDQVLALVFDDVQDLLAADALVFFDAKPSGRGEDAESPWQLEPRRASEIPVAFRVPGELLVRTATEGPQMFLTKVYPGTRSLRRLFPYAVAASLRVEAEILGGILLLNRTDPALRIDVVERLRLCETVAEQLARAFQDLDLAQEKARLERAVPAMISVSLASGMVHEIGTQADIGLNTLVPLRRAAEGSLTPAQRNGLGDAIAVFEKIGKLAGEYLNFGRPVQHAVEVRNRFESINVVVRDTLFSLRHETRIALLDTDLDPSLDRPHAFLDPKFLSLAIGNLVINAVRWIQEGGKITVSTARRGDGFVVRVEDWGPGVDEEARDKVFDAFYSRSKGGFGLGLTISRYIVRELHGGALRLVVPRHPTTFEIFLRNKTPQENLR